MTRHTCALLAAFFPAAIAAQTGHVTGYIVDRESGQPLSYGIVDIETIGRSMFTNDSGWFLFRSVSAAKYTLHARRLGYKPRDIDIQVRDGATDTLRVELTHVAVTLNPVDVKAYPPCLKPGAPSYEADSTLSAVVDQIRLNAEQYKFLADQYPYVYTSIVTRSSKLRRNGKVVRDPGSIDRYESRSKSLYEPGGVIQQRGKIQYFQVPTLVEVADKAFVDAHCWHWGGTETIDDEELIRADVVAFDSLKGPDVNGSFLVNSATFQIRRSIIHLSRSPRQLPELLDMEVTTDFFEVLPSIPIISHIYSVQSMNPARKSLVSEAYEEHRSTELRWVGRKPGETKQP